MFGSHSVLHAQQQFRHFLYFIFVFIFNFFFSLGPVPNPDLALVCNCQAWTKVVQAQEDFEPLKPSPAYVEVRVQINLGPPQPSPLTLTGLVGTWEHLYLFYLIPLISKLPFYQTSHLSPSFSNTLTLSCFTFFNSLSQIVQNLDCLNSMSSCDVF